MRAAVITLAIALATASGAYAQDTEPQSAAPQSGPFVLEPVHSPFVVAPEYKVTDIDHRTGQLAGVYAGKVIEDQLLVAGAVYKLTNLSRGTDLTYGGVLLGWTMAPEHRVRFGGRALVGIGEGEIPVTVQGFAPYPVAYDPRTIVRFGGGAVPQPIPAPQPTTFTVRVRDNFVVLEPEANVAAHLTDHVAVEFAAGYRATGASDALRDRLNGVTGSLALQFGW